MQQGQPHVPLAGPVLAGGLSRLCEHRGAGGNAAHREGAQELHGKEAFADDAHVMGSGCQLLANVAALCEADSIHESQVGLQGQGHSWGQVMDPLGNACRVGREKLAEG